MTIAELVRVTHEQSVREEVASIAQSLQETIGQRLTAFAVGVRDPKAIGRYARGERDPRAETDKRLREVFRVTQLLAASESPATVRAWLMGSNPQLDDHAPIELLHEQQVQPVLRAAQSFVTGG